MPTTLTPTGWLVEENNPTQVMYEPDDGLMTIDRVLINTGSGGGASIEAVTAATLPAADAGNIGSVYFVADRRGGNLVQSNGTSWVEIAPANLDVADTPATAFGSIGAGTVIGQTKRVTDLGNNPNVILVWNGAWWAPQGGQQTLYSMQSPVSSASGTTQTVTLPDVSIPAGLMGVAGMVRIDAAFQIVGGVNATSRTITMTWDGGTIMNETSAHQRGDWVREIINQGAANAQYIPQRSNEIGAPTTANTAGQTATKDTAASARVIAGSVASATVTAAVGQLTKYRVVLLGV